MKSVRILCIVAASAALLSCSSRVDDETRITLASHDAVLREMPRDFYRPGLGDLMHALQLRHAKLWFAGQAANWELAAFEMEELGESLERVARWHADSDEIAMRASLKAYMQSGRGAVDQSIRKQDQDAFAAAFDRLTDGCNQCHRAAHHAFIVIQRPTAEPVTNQRWAED